MSGAVKFAAGSDDLVEGFGLPYGGPIRGGKDLDGEYFTKKTDLALDWFGPGERPLIFHHGFDQDAGLDVVGRVTAYKVGNLGVWTQAQLDRSSEYFDAIKDLVEQGKLYFSSGSVDHLVRKKSSGEITRWPWIELSLTPTPANLYAIADFEEVSKRFDVAGIKSAGLQTVKAELDAEARNNLDDSDFAYIDSNGGRHLPIHDAAHVRAAMARFNQTQFESDSAKDSARRKILAKAKSLGIDVSDDSNVAKAWGLKHSAAYAAGKNTPVDSDDGDAPEGSYEDLSQDLSRLVAAKTEAAYAYVLATFPDYAICCVGDEGDQDYYRVGYTVGADGEPVLGQMTRVQRAYVPAPAEMDDAPMAVQSARFVTYASQFEQRTKDLHERRLREKRNLSPRVREHIEESVKALKATTEGLELLMAEAAAPDLTVDIEILRLFAAS